MNLGGKQDLDALLRSWPATPPKGLVVHADGGGADDEQRGWDERADAIVRAAQSAVRDGAAKDAAEALFAAAVLAPAAGEEAAVTAAGEKKMSQEKEPGESPASSTATPMPGPATKRTSLKDIAARASQSGARLSNPGASSPGASSPSAAPASMPAPSAPLPRPAEASKDDSGVINLQVVQATATAQQRADAEKAKPAQAGLFEDEKTVESAKGPPVPATPPKVASVTVLQPRKSHAGAIGGVLIAVVGIAAAVAIMSRRPLAPPPAPITRAETAVSAAPTAVPPPAAPTAVASTEAAPSASAEPDTKVAEAPKGPALGAAPSGAASAASAAPDVKVAVKGPMPSGKTGDLQSEMAKAVGKDGAAKPEAPAGPTPEPAAGGPRSQNIPEQPSQGAVAAAFGAVMGGAKSCVSGADDVSRASVTFSSAGTVSSVSVSGWAAAHGKSGCVQAALKGAKVGAFSKPSFTVGVPIRP